MKPPLPSSTPGAEAKRPLRRRVLSYVVSMWNLLAMGLLILLAYLFPRVGMTGGSVRAEYSVTWGGVGLIFLIAGMSLSLEALKKGLPHVQAHLVCNGFTYLVAPTLAFGFGSAGREAGLDRFVMGGLVVTGGLPTTVASNVSCTLMAGGNTALASIEVLFSNVLGPFLAPLLARLFLTPRSGWDDVQPGKGDLTSIYVRMAKQLSATLVSPMLLGLLIQHFLPKPVAWLRRTFHLAKVAAFLTTLCVWHSFSDAFASGAFLTASHASIIYLCFMSWGAYLILTALVFLVVRLPGVPGRAAAWWRMSKRDSLAMLFCGPAKGVAVGAPVISILYADRALQTQAKLALALVIYQGEQVAMAQVVVPLFKWWARDEVEAERERVREKEEERRREKEARRAGGGRTAGRESREQGWYGEKGGEESRDEGGAAGDEAEHPDGGTDTVDPTVGTDDVDVERGAEASACQSRRPSIRHRES